MTAEEIEAIRQKLGWTQAVMAQHLACDFVSYKRYATNARPVPRYIARSALLLEFIHDNGLMKALEKALDK
ncbi:helix-turn-helix domain-containing protein [Acidovorax temperans]|uniref:transcriptional regulator n=1 Tax=Acidovorax temperans TaxID=80878 RepID=UPI0023593BDB|nr:transcriptional regulator [Acidovorax temperans]WCT26625.1 transcriptional regulator [Acidovorax temperans]